MQHVVCRGVRCVCSGLWLPPVGVVKHSLGGFDAPWALSWLVSRHKGMSGASSTSFTVCCSVLCGRLALAAYLQAAFLHHLVCMFKWQLLPSQECLATSMLSLPANLISGNGAARSGFVYFRMVERCPAIQCGGGKYAVSGGSHCRIVCSKL